MQSNCQFLTPEQVAARLQVSQWTLRHWRRTGTGGPPWVRLGPRVIRYDSEALEGFVRRDP
jgi:hypothetical protein